jgi:SagB-type dehydrogenase family enzyme
LRAPGTKKKRAKATPRGRAAKGAVAKELTVRLLDHVALAHHPSGDMVVTIGDFSASIGKFSAATAQRAQELRAGLPLRAVSSQGSAAERETHLLVRWLAARGLVEYPLGRARGADQVVIEPQQPDYWPKPQKLRDNDALVLSRFAYLRRRAGDMVLESPRAAALFRIGDPRIAAVLASLAVPQKVKDIRRAGGLPNVDLLGLLVDCQILFRVTGADKGLRPTEGDSDLVLWDFHDLLFHARSTEGRHANPVGGLYAHVDTIAPQPAVRPNWPGETIDLQSVVGARPPQASPVARLLNDRHSTRDFDNADPITLAEVAAFLDAAARVRGTMEAPLDPDADPAGGGPMLTYTTRPYPSGGASYELELYLAVDTCKGLPRGFYHYDPGAHALTRIDARDQDIDAMLKGAEYAMGVSAVPQIVITIAARFGRVSWKYGSIAYALILKDTGVLMQTFYMMATDMGLGGCAIGTTNIDLFEKMTALPFHAEGPVGQFALGRGAQPSG